MNLWGTLRGVEKPHLRRWRGLWWYYCIGTQGFGRTIEEAVEFFELNKRR